ncbi:MAG: FHA domain-containing protein [Anaerolineales bacterium]|nr:FHA domain-containing protein [Anaerolineales bacterium]
MKDRSEEVPFLIAPDGELRGKRWPLVNSTFIIGRDQDCNLVLVDRQVSRHHARISRTSEGYFLEDLGSKNHTHLNGESIESEVLLQDGDEIQVALAIRLTFIGSEATLPLSVEEVVRFGIGRLRMEVQAHRVWVNEKEVDPPLSPPQFRLLELLYRSSGKIVTRDEIASHVWPGTDGIGVSDQAIDALIRRLRDRIFEVDPEYKYVITVRGHGFRLENPIP